MTAWLIDTLLYTGVLIALVLLLRRPVARYFGPKLAYALWALPALRLMLPPIELPASMAPQPAPLGDQALLALAMAAQAYPAEAPAPTPLWERTDLWLAFWLASAAVFLAWRIKSYLCMRRELLAEARPVGEVGRIRLVETPAVSSPVAFGLRDKVVALPPLFMAMEDRPARDLAIAHELAHHRGHDIAANFAAQPLLALHWFNPLAWVGWRAMRRDQEAACDARVLDRANGGNRAAYAQAITKAASGRALLFAGALDRPRTLHRRLASMLTSPSTARRLAGKALVAITAAAALPLTASYATEYVDVPAHGHAAALPAAAPDYVAHFAAAGSVAAASTAAPAAQVAGGALPYPDLGGVHLGRNDVAFLDDDTILISGTRKTLEQLSAAERARLRHAIASSKQDLARDRERLPRELAEAKREAERARSGELRREHQQEIADLRRDLAELQSRADELRAEGENPEDRRAEILRDLRHAEAEDIAAEEREAIADADASRRIAEMRQEEAQMARLLAKLDALERK